MTVSEPRHSPSKMGPALIRVLKVGPLFWLAELMTSSRFVVHGDSMLPNIHREQYVLVRRLSPYRGGPNRGDVLVFQHHLKPGISFMKRVVGLPGDRVQVRQGQVFIDGRPLDEPYLKGGPGAPGTTEPEPSAGSAAEAEWTLHGDQYFVLGDNRVHSDDSRRFGPVDRESIIGIAWLRYWPPAAWGRLRSSRLLKKGVSVKLPCRWSQEHDDVRL